MQPDALLTVCFGTADPGRFARCFAAVHAAAGDALPPGGRLLAVSGASVRRRLAAAGAVYPAPEEALGALAAAGARRVAVLALYLCGGAEYRALGALCEAWRGRFAALRLTRPLLEADPAGLAAAVDTAFPALPGQGLVLLGHGAPGAGEGYARLAALLAKAGRRDCALALLHGAPGPADAARALAARGYPEARLDFLMLCAGHHARQALAPGGAADALRAAGLAVAGGGAGPVQLGECPAVRRLFACEAARAFS